MEKMYQYKKALYEKGEVVNAKNRKSLGTTIHNKLIVLYEDKLCRVLEFITIPTGVQACIATMNYEKKYYVNEEELCHIRRIFAQAEAVKD